LLRENAYQAKLIRRIYERFPGCFVEKSDSALKQGIPDLSIFFPGGFWAKLEVKSDVNADHQPNQDFYIQKFEEMCFAAFIYPENEEAVLHELEQEYEAHRAARLS
jgi:hypothetical protein